MRSNSSLLIYYVNYPSVGRRTYSGLFIFRAGSSQSAISGNADEFSWPNNIKAGGMISGFIITIDLVMTKNAAYPDKPQYGS